MLKKFFLNMLSSFVGAWFALLLFIGVGVFLVLAVASKVTLGSGSTQSVSKHSILTIDLEGEIAETDVNLKPDVYDLLNGQIERPQTLSMLVAAIGEAANNKNVDCIYLKCKGVSAAPATLDALREALLKFKKSGKKIYSYGDAYMAGDYYVASVSDSIFLNPYGTVEMHGLGSTSLYMKGLFDKLGISFQVVKVGTFKSAVEPYTMDEMSAPARAQLDTLFGNMWGYMRAEMCKTRKRLTPAKIDSLINTVNITFAPVETALTNGLVDRLAYERTMNAFLARQIDVEEKKLNFISPSVLVGQTPWGNAYGSKKQIAVLYATGEIADGSSSGINFENLVPVITKLAKDEKVKGMVLRVNSPGGSAFGSDQIGEALDYFKSTGKPLAVSMGDYAASGGYWISCGADLIFADPLTITGSIGIFGLIPNGKALLDKIGVNPQSTGTNPSANFPTLFKPLDESQLSVMQEYVTRGYDRFINRVAKGRKMSESSVRKIAEGRVWDAIMARKIGLVDSLGTLDKAIEWTAKKADLFSEYDIAVYPMSEPTVWDMIPVNGTMQKLTSNLLKENYEQFCIDYVKTYLSRSPIQARMPEFKVMLGAN